ncbi:unnamed protein product [Hymenolepis diminuta]|uniref:Guanylate cyclase domain-containing protein n=1 Tax=Hymenolepis diminuta TaxID=6216 RepID=A0A564Y744_HYMDI|nr:unnamed protein product [Hymenolepis diminuta]
MALVDLIYIIIIVPVRSLSFDNLMGDDRLDLLTLYYFNSQPHCAPEIELFNYTRSARRAVNYVLTETADDALYAWRIIPIMLYGCSVQEELRGPVLTKTLQEIKANASMSDGYSVLLGPPLINDCDMVSQWIIAGDPRGTKMNQLYQISYRCYIFGSTSDFATFPIDSTKGTHFYPPINAVSVTVPWHTFIKAIATFLLTSEWNRIAIFVDYNTINFDVSMLLQSASLTLSTTKLRQHMHIRADKSICIDMNFTELIYPLEESLDVILILGNAKLAVSFLWQIQNLTRIKEGRIAIIHVNLGDMYAYDSLVSWKAALAERASTLTAGLSLILFTALPINAKYEEDSYIYDEEINLSMAHAAAFAMRMAQMNNLMKGGDVPTQLGFFDSLHLMEVFRVPTLPGLDFFYKHDSGIDILGLFDMLLFTLKQDITNMTKYEIELKKPSDMFQLNYLIRYPYILPQTLKPISWPGDGKGPMQTSCLITRCGFDKLWLSPELLRDEELATVGTKPGDVYAFSLIMYEIFYFWKPYSHAQMSTENVIQRVKTGESPPFRPQMSKKELPPEYRDILECCWLENPSLRPTFRAIRDRIRELTKRKKLNIIEHMLEKLDKYSNKLELEVEKRKEELEIEKKKNEQLVCRMLPLCVAEALKDGITVAPEMYDEVSIYFSDIVGFTSIAAMSTPMEVVNLLNDLYTLFDSAIAKYDVYKVETIGDAYMIASGLPVRNGRRHASEVALTALDLLSVCGTFKIRHLPQVPLRVRIGLHSGPCVAGVVGLIMPRYCVFGDTVNQAQKMESSGAAFRIHVSQRMKDALEEIGGYHTEFHGIIEFEGGIATNGYWLIGCDIFTKSLPEPPPVIKLVNLP